MKPTMKMIAEELGLSINAVSLALGNKPGVSEKTRNLVLETAESMGYFDQKKGKYRKTFASSHIGVLITRKNYRSRFYAQIMYGIEREANSRGYYVVTRFVEDEKLWQSMEDKMFCGILAVGVVDEETLKRLKRYGIPVVLVDNTSYFQQFDCILTDNRIGTYQSVSYLLEQGYRNIGFFGEFSYSHSNRERYWGYLEAMLHHFGDLGQVNAISSKYSILGEMDDEILHYDMDKIVEMIRQKKNLAEAYQCGNDEGATVLCNALKILGYRIPEDIAVIGFDDVEYANMTYPKLTTLHVRIIRMGKEAVRKLLWRLDHKDADTSKTILPVDLVIRESTKQKETDR